MTDLQQQKFTNRLLYGKKQLKYETTASNYVRWNTHNWRNISKVITLARILANISTKKSIMHINFFDFKLSTNRNDWQEQSNTWRGAAKTGEQCLLCCCMPVGITAHDRTLHSFWRQFLLSLFTHNSDYSIMSAVVNNTLLDTATHLMEKRTKHLPIISTHKQETDIK
jgi:hypothetical protein